MVVRKIRRGPIPNVALLTVAEFGYRFKAQATAARAADGGYDVTIKDFARNLSPASRCLC